MTLVYLGIVIVLLQSYIRLRNRHNDLFKEHIYMMETVLADISKIKNKCHNSKNPE